MGHGTAGLRGGGYATPHRTVPLTATPDACEPRRPRARDIAVARLRVGVRAALDCVYERDYRGL